MREGLDRLLLDVSLWTESVLDLVLADSRINFVLLVAILLLVVFVWWKALKAAERWGKVRPRRTLVRRHRSKTSHKQKPSGKEMIAHANWREFERLTARALRESGFNVRENHSNLAEADGGVDLVAHRGGKSYVVQCKHWRRTEVDVKVVRELYGVMSARGDDGCILVCTGGFTKPARSWSKAKPVTLLHGEALRRMLDGSRIENVIPTPSAAEQREIQRRNRSGRGLSCPVCGADMALRKAKQGPNAGQEFWGCTRYPQCRGVRPG